MEELAEKSALPEVVLPPSPAPPGPEKGDQDKASPGSPSFELKVSVSGGAEPSSGLISFVEVTVLLAGGVVVVYAVCGLGAARRRRKGGAYQAVSLDPVDSPPPPLPPGRDSKLHTFV